MNWATKFRVCVVALAFALPGPAQVEKVAMRTSGISCGICAGLSEIYFHRVVGVEQVKISLKSEAIMLVYRPDATFDPEELRGILKPLKVEVLQFQISARGQIRAVGDKRYFLAGKNKFAVLDAIDSPDLPVNTPVRIEGILFDHAKPMKVKVLTVQLAR